MCNERLGFALNIRSPGNSYLALGWDDPLLSSDLKRKIQKIKISVPALQRYSSSIRLIEFFREKRNCVMRFTIMSGK